MDLRRQRIALAENVNFSKRERSVTTACHERFAAHASVGSEILDRGVLPSSLVPHSRGASVADYSFTPYDVRLGELTFFHRLTHGDDHSLGAADRDALS